MIRVNINQSSNTLFGRENYIIGNGNGTTDKDQMFRFERAIISFVTLN